MLLLLTQWFSRDWLFAAPCTAALQASLSFTISWCLLKLMAIKLVMSSTHLIPCHPLLLLPSIFPSIRGFSNESTLRIRWPKYWSFIFIMSPSNKYSGLISFRIDWFDLLVVPVTLKSLLQHHSLNASFFQCSDFFIVQLSHPYKTTGKTIAWTIWSFVGKVLSLQHIKICRLQTDGEIYRVHGLEESTLSKWPYYPKLSTDSMQSLSSYQRYFSQN